LSWLWRAVLFEGVYAGLGAYRVMIAGVARDANGADDFALHNDGDAAFNGHSAFETKNAKASAAGGEGLLKSLGRALEAGRGACFRDADIGAAELRVVHLLVVDKVSAGVYDGDGHIPVIFSSLGESRCSGLFCVLNADGRAVGIGHLGKSRKSAEREEQSEGELFVLR